MDIHMLYAQSLQHQLTSLHSQLPQALTIAGPDGSGKTTLARSLCAQLVRYIVEPTDAKGQVDVERGIIRVSQIRHLLKIARTDVPRAIIIDNAHLMNVQSQNALLKLLEEPPASTYFILCTADTSKLLPTVLSRTQIIQIPPINERQSAALLEREGITDQVVRSQILFIAQGRAAQLVNLARSAKKRNEYIIAANDAKRIIQSSAYTRLTTIRKYTDSKTHALDLLSVLISITKKALHTQPSKEQVAQLERYATAFDAIAKNGNVRAHMLTAVL